MDDFNAIEFCALCGAERTVAALIVVGGAFQCDRCHRRHGEDDWLDEYERDDERE